MAATDKVAYVEFMANDPENLVLVLLRRLDGKLDRIAADMREVQRLLTTVEDRLTSIKRTLARPYNS